MSLKEYKVTAHDGTQVTYFHSDDYMPPSLRPSQPLQHYSDQAELARLRSLVLDAAVWIDMLETCAACEKAAELRGKLG